MPLDEVEELGGKAVHLHRDRPNLIEVIIVKMTAGIAAASPAAVAIRASEIPGATTARVADPWHRSPGRHSLCPIPSRKVR